MPHIDIDDIGDPVHTTLEQFVETAMHLGNGADYNVDDPDNRQPRTHMERGHMRITATHADLAAAHRFTRFAVTGKHPDFNDHVYLSLNNYAPDPERGLEVTRDFDSIIGVSRTLPFCKAVGIWAFPDFKRCLSKHNHVYTKFLKDGQEHCVALAHVPNLALFSAGERQVTRVYFPSRWEGRHSVPAVPSEICAPLFNDVIRPVRLLVQPESYTPPSYSTEETRCTRKKNAFIHTLYDIPANRLADFTREFLALLNLQPYGAGAFFHHEIKGVKSRTYHDPTNEVDVANALRSAFEPIDLAAVLAEGDESQWLVDVAVEVGSPGHVGLFRKDSHHLILKNMLGIDTETALNKLGMSTFVSDTTMMLSEVAGFRTEHDGSDRNGTTYLNVYHTEKSPTYLVDEGHYAKFNTPSSVLKLITAGATELKAMEKADEVFAECRSVAHGFPARMEARVALKNAGTAHRDFDQDFLRRVLYLVPNDLHWEAKMIRQRAFKMIVEWMMNAPRRDLATQQALSLLCIVVFMSNALCARPEQGAKFDNVMRAILPFRFDEETQEDEPFNPFGIVFVRDIHLDGQCPELRDGRMITSANLGAFFDCASLKDVQDIVLSKGSNKRVAASHPGHHQNKMRKTMERDYDADIEPLFSLEEKGITFPHLKPDVVARRDEMIEGYDDDELSTNHTATKIFLQLALCYVQKSKTGKTSSVPSSIILTAEERLEQTPDLFRRDDLHNIFSHIGIANNYEQVKGITQWDTAFKWVFREFGQEECDAIQGYMNMSYFLWYRELRLACQKRGRGGEKVLEAYRKELRVLFDTFKWFPKSVSDRPYSAEKRDKATIYPKTHTGTAPIILFNPRFKKQMQLKLKTMNFTGEVAGATHT